jgi:hypothetical protein
MLKNQHNSDEIKALILQLHQNDIPEIYSGTIEPKKPIRTMNRLIEISHEAIPFLIKELEKFEKEFTEKYYPEYIIEILGEIGDSRSLEILARMVNNKYLLLDVDITVKAVAKLGFDVIPFYLKRVKETKSNEEITNALWVFDEINEKNEEVLKFAKDILKQHKDMDIKLFAVSVIGTHGSQKDLYILEKYLNSKDDEEKDTSKKAVQKLFNENPAKLREILTKYKIIGSQRCENFGRDMNNMFSMLGYRYSEKGKFEGNNASELNEAVTEYFTRKATIDMIYKMQNFGTDEGLLSEIHEEKILDVWRDLNNIQRNHIEQYPDAISIFDYYFIHPEIKSEKTQSFKGLYPISNDKLQKIQKWFEMQGFEISKITNDIIYTSHYILARKNNKKGCIVYLYKTDNKRVWANVKFQIIGEDWTFDEIKNIQTTFWNQFLDVTKLR